MLRIRQIVAPLGALGRTDRWIRHQPNSRLQPILTAMKLPILTAFLPAATLFFAGLICPLAAQSRDVSSGEVALDEATEEDGAEVGEGLQVAVPLNAPMPLALGSRWTYSINDNAKIELRITKIEKVGGVACAKLESMINGRTVSSEWLAYHNNALRCFRSDTQEGKVVFKTPLNRMPIPAKIDTTWKSSWSGPDGTVFKGEFELAAGKKMEFNKKSYSTTVVSGSVTGEGANIDTVVHYAKGVGPLRQAMVLNGRDLLMKLLEFHPGRPESTRPMVSRGPRPSTDVVEEEEVVEEPVVTGVDACKSCQSPLSSGAKFCSQCGTKVVRRPTACRGCGHKIGPTAKFCAQCGTGVGG